MHHRQNAHDYGSFNQSDKNWTVHVDEGKEREMFLKREQMVSSILEDAPRSIHQAHSQGYAGQGDEQR